MNGECGEKCPNDNYGTCRLPTDHEERHYAKGIIPMFASSHRWAKADVCGALNPDMFVFGGCERPAGKHSAHRSSRKVGVHKFTTYWSENVTRDPRELYCPWCVTWLARCETCTPLELTELMRTREHAEGCDWPSEKYGGQPQSPEVSPRSSVLREAEGLITGDRNKTYGSPTENFSNIAALWNVQVGHKLSAPLTATDVGVLLAQVKMARMIAQPKRDNYVDAAGYLACAFECQEAEDAA